MPSTSRRIKGRDRLILLASGSEVTAQTGTATYVAVPVATQLAIITQPAGAVDAVAFTTQPVIELRSSGGSAVLQGGVTVTASIVAGAGTLVGAVTAVTATDGRATFATLGIDASAPPASFTVRFSASGLTSVDSNSFTVASGSGSRTADFFSKWGTTGTSDTVLTDTNKWSSRWGGTPVLAVVNTPPTGCPTPNALRCQFGTGSFDWVMAKSLWTQPAIGSSRWFRYYVNNDVADSIDGGTGYAATHPIESEGDASGISGNFYTYHLGSRTDGTGEFYISFDANSRQFCCGGAGGANPTTIAKHTWWRVETQFLRTATSTYTIHMRVYNQSGTLTYSDADGLDNMYVWGGGKMSANNTGLTVDQAHVEELRFGINGGFAASGTQYVYYAGFATASDTWCGAYGSFTGET